MPDITIDDITAPVGPCLGEYSRLLATLMRDGEDGFKGQGIPRALAAFANSRLPEQARTKTDQCPERFAAAVLRSMGNTISQPGIDAESAAVQRRLRWHLKK